MAIGKDVDAWLLYEHLDITFGIYSYVGIQRRVGDGYSLWRADTKELEVFRQAIVGVIKTNDAYIPIGCRFAGVEYTGNELTVALVVSRTHQYGPEVHVKSETSYPIVGIVLAAEKYSGFDTSRVRAEIETKRIWPRDYEPEEYALAVGEDRDIFELWMEKGYIDKRLLPDA